MNNYSVKGMIMLNTQPSHSLMTWKLWDLESARTKVEKKGVKMTEIQTDTWLILSEENKQPHVHVINVHEM